MTTRRITLLLSLLCSISPAGCRKQAAPPRDHILRDLSVRPSAASLADLNRSVMQEGHQPWRQDVKWVAEVEINTALEDMGIACDQSELKVVAHGFTATASLDRNTPAGLTSIQLSLENTRRAGDGVWFADRIVVIQHASGVQQVAK